MKTFYIVGLGNPGTKYEKTRHNAGFMVADALSRELHAPEFKLKKNAHALIPPPFVPPLSRGGWGGLSMIIAKPQTYMNLSGKSVAALLKRDKLTTEKLNNCLLVVSDDLDLPLGTLRFRERGTAGGHQGLQSVINALGTEEFPRLKIGIRPPSLSRQPGKAEEFVLKKFTKEEFTLLQETVVPKAIKEILSRIH